MNSSSWRLEGVNGGDEQYPELLFISTVDLLQPPWATVDLLQPPRAPVHPASTTRYSTVYCSSSPPHHGVLFIQRQCHRSLFIPEAASIGFN